MGFHEAEIRLRKTGIWTLILVMGLFIIPGILVKIWSTIQIFASERGQFNPDRFQAIALTTVTLGVCGWILVGLLKEE